jgi:hypothetical protein
LLSPIPGSKASAAWNPAAHRALSATHWVRIESTAALHFVRTMFFCKFVGRLMTQPTPHRHPFCLLLHVGGQREPVTACVHLDTLRTCRTQRGAFWVWVDPARVDDIPAASHHHRQPICGHNLWVQLIAPIKALFRLDTHRFFPRTTPLTFGWPTTRE